MSPIRIVSGKLEIDLASIGELHLPAGVISIDGTALIPSGCVIHCAAGTALKGNADEPLTRQSYAKSESAGTADNVRCVGERAPKRGSVNAPIVHDGKLIVRISREDL